MVNYIGNMLDEIPEDMRGESEIPATHNIFDIVEDVSKQSQTNADIFHYFVAQLLYM